MNNQVRKLLLALTLLSLVAMAHAQSSAFTYQGRLTDQVAPANGIYDLRFNLFGASSGGPALTGAIDAEDVVVSNGLFTVTLGFDVRTFTGEERWLEIAVRPGTSTGAYTNLAPRQPLTSTPYAVRAANFSGVVADTQLSANIARLNAPAAFTGPVSFSNTSNHFSGAFSGNGVGMTNIDLTFNSAGTITRGGFVVVSSPGVGSSPTCVIAADVNGDGKADLISATSQTLTVLTNNGSGGFTLSSSPGGGQTFYSVTAADVNGDGRLDLIGADVNPRKLVVVTNNGSGAFALSSSLSVAHQPYSVTAADVNGDSKVDLISGSQNGNTLSVVTNNGTGSFVLASSPVVGQDPQWVTSADVNGDGKVDLISANVSDNTLSVMTNNGSGGFTLASSPSVGVTPVFVTTADINGDGKVDLISANVPNTLSLFTNNGSGGFALASSPIVGRSPFSVTAADVDGEGKVDLISASYDDNSLTVLTNSGSGSFGLASLLGVGRAPNSVAAADLNGDGRVDLISANSSDNTLTVLFNTLKFTASFAGNFIGYGAGLTGLNAANLVGPVPAASLTSVPADSLTGTIADARLSANVALRNANQTFTGNNTIASPATLSFGSGTRQMLNLFDTVYGVGVQAFTLYNRSDSGFAWFKQGVHSDAANDPGSGGMRMMMLDGNGELHVGGGIFAGLSLQNRETTNYVGGPTAGERWVWYVSQGICRLWSGSDRMSVNNAGTVTAVSFNPTSDRNLKENFASVSPREVLDKVAALPISRWNFKGDATTPHLGPMAQDFHAAFGVGTDDKHIATVDADGVALAAIQGLNQKVDTENATLRAENAELKRRLEKLERRLEHQTVIR